MQFGPFMGFKWILREIERYLGILRVLIDSEVYRALQTIAAYLCVHLGWLDKLQEKAVTHFCEVEWWRTLMVECVTVF